MVNFKNINDFFKEALTILHKTKNNAKLYNDACTVLKNGEAQFNINSRTTASNARALNAFRSKCEGENIDEVINIITKMATNGIDPIQKSS